MTYACFLLTVDPSHIFQRYLHIMSEDPFFIAMLSIPYFSLSSLASGFFSRRIRLTNVNLSYYFSNRNFFFLFLTSHTILLVSYLGHLSFLQDSRPFPATYFPLHLSSLSTHMASLPLASPPLCRPHPLIMHFSDTLFTTLWKSQNIYNRAQRAHYLHSAHSLAYYRHAFCSSFLIYSWDLVGAPRKESWLSICTKRDQGREVCYHS